MPRPPNQAAPAPPARRTGRPRRDGRAVADPTDEILRTAGALFGEYGVSGTTMASLAAGAGLGQSSLYYYFRSKDEVLAALVARANVIPLDLLDRVYALPDSAAVKLFLFVRGDVEALCALPFDINEVHRIAARDRDRFADYWSERSRLERRLAAIVRAGIDEGTFRTVDVWLAALTIISNDEAVQNWYRLGSNRRPRAVGHALAEMTVAGLLDRANGLTTIVSAAEAVAL